VGSSKVIYDTYLSLGAKNTPMDGALTFIIENPDKVHNSQQIVGKEKGAKKGEAIYSVKVITGSENEKTSIHVFSLRVGRDSTEVSYVKDGETMEFHCQKKGVGIDHKVFTRKVYDA